MAKTARASQVEPAPIAVPEPPGPEPAPTPPEPVPTPPEAPGVRIGDRVVMRAADGDHDATVLFARGDAAFPQVDLAYYQGGKPLAVGNVHHGFGAGCWSRPGAVESKPSVEEMLAAAEARGERVPKVGLWVQFLINVFTGSHSHVIATRARVTEVYDPRHVRLDVYKQQPPDDPSIEDAPVDRRVSIGHGTTTGESWCHVGEFIQQPSVREVSPSRRCSHCGTDKDSLVPIYVDHIVPGIPMLPPPLGQVCAACQTKLADWLVPPPVAAGV